MFSKASGPNLGTTQPSFQWVPGVKWHGYEADHSPPSVAMVKNEGIYTSILPYIFTVCIRLPLLVQYTFLVSLKL
jgi:hypothetical protein